MMLLTTVEMKLNTALELLFVLYAFVVAQVTIPLFLLSVLSELSARQWQ